MSTRPLHAGATENRPNRLSVVLSAGLESGLSLGICAPCARNPRPVQRRAAATGLLVENDVDTDWSRIAAPRYPDGPRFTRGCPDDDPGCPDDDKVNIDPISLDQFDIGKEIMVLGCGHCYNPEPLARWARSKKSRKCLYNDYNMTSAELAEIGVTAEEAGAPWIEDLIRIYPEPATGFVEYYQRENGVLVLKVVQDEDDGREFIFEGPVGDERKVRCRHVDGDIDFFEGANGEERLIRSEWSTGEVEFFSGDADEERKERLVLPTGETQYFEGLQGEERLVRITFSNTGQISYYEGEQDEERMVKSVFADGDIHLFEGPRDEEKKVVAWVQLEDGSREYRFFEGSKGEERLVRREANGEVFLYEGPKKQERFVSRFPMQGDSDADGLFD